MATHNWIPQERYACAFIAFLRSQEVSICDIWTALTTAYNECHGMSLSHHTHIRIAEYQPTQVNGCLKLSGSDYLQTSLPYNFGAAETGISISFWFQFTGSSSVNSSPVFNFGNGAGVDNVMASRSATSNNLVLVVWQGNSISQGITVIDAWPTGSSRSISVFLHFLMAHILLFQVSRPLVCVTGDKEAMLCLDPATFKHAKSHIRA